MQRSSSLATMTPKYCTGTGLCRELLVEVGQLLPPPLDEEIEPAAS